MRILNVWPVSVLAIFCASPSPATVLIFQPATGTFGDFGALAQGYGNRVTSTVQDGFLYSLDGGPTPNVVVEHSTGAMAQLYTWSTQYGDLSNVVFAYEPLPFQMRLVADPGYTVTLHSFDMACWPNLDYIINSVSVLDGNGSVLFSLTNPLIEGDAGGPAHSHFDFGPAGLTGAVIVVGFDSTNVDSDDVGIDNIKFSQSAVVSCDPDVNQDGNADQDDVLYLVNVVGGGGNPTGIDPDFNHDGNVDQDDVSALINTVGGGGCP